ncbi:hypothetical protein SCHPADRAFT_945786 [Schizopora paradoxa]|uniref:BTB domain-containing protein n=1 Tax=Schizopora paradoxa TaxID=27342 RepID=A0A0H2RBD6_9AGAM|nr:hypothetical protein SCHPADRAFT_945786 [Schizopora paradoxa]
MTASGSNSSNPKPLVGESMEANRLQRPTPHESLWFDDGSIVLQTDVHLYRVHKSILAKYSSVFRDMLDMSSGGGRNGNSGGNADADSWDGLPLVRMAGDSDENVYHLLMTLYDRDYYDIHKRTTLPIIVSLLSMSTKYDIPTLRTHVINQLEKYFPVHVERAIEEEGTNEPLFEPGVSKDCDLQLLAVAQRCNVRRLLPMLYYKCAISKLRFILASSDNLEKDVLHKIIIGRERLVELSYDFGVLFLFPSEQCKSEICPQMRRGLIEIWTRTSDLGPRRFPIFMISKTFTSVMNDHLLKFACEICAQKSARAREEFKTKFWDELPKIFGLGTWAEILSDG